MQAKRMMAAGMLLMATTLPGCMKPATIEADHAWVRLPAVAGRPGAGYFILHGGAVPTSLVAVSADLALRTEMHETMNEGGNEAGGAGGSGMMTMRPVGDLPLPAGGVIRFVPGGRHLMLFGVSPDLKPGDPTLLTFTFADGSRLQRKAWAVGAGDPAPQ